VERGDTGLGRDAYGLPRRRRLGDRRAYRPDDDAGLDGPDGDDDDEYGQLLRRPGERPFQPDRSRMRPPPGRFSPPPGDPADGFAPNRAPGNGAPMTTGPANGGPMNGGTANGGPMPGGAANGGPMPGRQYRLPNGRRVPSRADRPYRPQAPGPGSGMRGPWDQPGPGHPPGQDPLGSSWRRPPRPQAPAGPPPGADGDPLVHGHAPGAGGMPGAGGYAGASGFAGASRIPEGSRFPDGSGFAGGPAGSGRAGSGYAGPGAARPGPAGPGPAGLRPEGQDGWGRLGDQAPRGVRGGSLPGEAAGVAAQVIRQRESAVPDERPAAAAQSAVSIAPDGLDSFARDLRALRSKAELDYPEMAETSHYTMKTLVSAAGGMRLPTLPVAVAYVRACGGNVAEWEERWQKLATKITADAAKKRRGDGEELQAPPEPADQLALPEPPAPPAAQEPPAESGEVYVITSAKPRQPGW
jgi:hypothetical protein